MTMYAATCPSPCPIQHTGMAGIWGDLWAKLTEKVYSEHGVVLPPPPWNGNTGGTVTPSGYSRSRTPTGSARSRTPTEERESKGKAKPRPVETTATGAMTAPIEETLTSYAPILLAAGLGLVLMMVMKK